MNFEVAKLVQSAMCKTRVGIPRPSPSLFFFPGLSSRPIEPRGRFEFEDRFRESIAVITDEYHALKSSRSSDYDSTTEHKLHDGNWEWNSYILKGKRSADFAVNCPKTVELLESLEAPRLMVGTPFSFSFFSTLGPKSVIKAHYGPCNLRLRCHLPLIVPEGDCGIQVGNEIVRWKVGEPLIFDDCYEHHVWNNTDAQRVVLLFDMWHPELVPDEILAITDMFGSASKKAPPPPPPRPPNRDPSPPGMAIVPRPPPPQPSSSPVRGPPPPPPPPGSSRSGNSPPPPPLSAMSPRPPPPMPPGTPRPPPPPPSMSSPRPPPPPPGDAPPPRPPMSSLLSSIQTASLKKKDDGESSPASPGPPPKPSLLSSIAGGQNNLRKSTYVPQEEKPADLPGSSLLKKVQATKKTTQSAGSDDDDEDGWSDDDAPAPPPVDKSQKLQQMNLKPTVTKPPAVSKAAPSRVSFKAPAPPPDPEADKSVEDAVAAASQLVENSRINAMTPPRRDASTTGPVGSSQGAESEADIDTAINDLVHSLNETPSSGHGASSASAAIAHKRMERLKELEQEVFDLKKKLERAESRLSSQQGEVGSHARELTLERDLDEAHRRIIDLRSEKVSLETSVKELQSRLTQEQSKNGSGSSRGGSQSAAAALSAAQHRGEREKELQTLLIKAKTDKDKAIRVIINLVGKEKMAEFLNQHAGSPDILDAMVTSFGSEHSDSGASASLHASSSARSPIKTSTLRKSRSSPLKSPTASWQARSRIEEYYRSVVVNNLG